MGLDPKKKLPANVFDKDGFLQKIRALAFYPGYKTINMFLNLFYIHYKIYLNFHFPLRIAFPHKRMSYTGLLYINITKTLGSKFIL